MTLTWKSYERPIQWLFVEHTRYQKHCCFLCTSHVQELDQCAITEDSVRIGHEPVSVTSGVMCEGSGQVSSTSSSSSSRLRV